MSLKLYRPQPEPTEPQTPVVVVPRKVLAGKRKSGCCGKALKSGGRRLIKK